MHFIFFLIVCSLLIQHCYIHPTWLSANTISISFIIIQTLNNPGRYLSGGHWHIGDVFHSNLPSYNTCQKKLSSHFFKWNLLKIYHVGTNILFFLMEDSWRSAKSSHGWRYQIARPSSSEERACGKPRFHRVHHGVCSERKASGTQPGSGCSRHPRPVWQFYILPF